MPDHDDYIFYKQRGLCAECRKNHVATGFVSCPQCLERKALWSINRDKAKHNQRNRELYKQHKLAGVCVSCKCRKAMPGKTKCETCSKRQKLYAAQKYVRKEKPSGICYRKDCDGSTVNGTHYCEAHYIKMVEHAKMMRNKAKESRR